MPRSRDLHEYVLGEKAFKKGKDKEPRKPNQKKNPEGYWRAVLKNVLSVPKVDKQPDDPRMWMQSALDYLKLGSESPAQVVAFAKVALLYRALEAAAHAARPDVVGAVKERLGLKTPGFATRLGRAAKSVAMSPVTLPAKAVGAVAKAGVKAVGKGLLNKAMKNPAGALKTLQVAREFAHRGSQAVAESAHGLQPRRPIP